MAPENNATAGRGPRDDDGGTTTTRPLVMAFRRNAGPNDAIVVWALGKPF